MEDSPPGRRPTTLREERPIHLSTGTPECVGPDPYQWDRSTRVEGPFLGRNTGVEQTSEILQRTTPSTSSDPDLSLGVWDSIYGE